MVNIAQMLGSTEEALLLNLLAQIDLWFMYSNRPMLVCLHWSILYLSPQAKPNTPTTKLKPARFARTSVRIFRQCKAPASFVSVHTSNLLVVFDVHLNPCTLHSRYLYSTLTCHWKQLFIINFHSISSFQSSSLTFRRLRATSPWQIDGEAEKPCLKDTSISNAVLWLSAVSFHPAWSFFQITHL